MHVYYSSLTPQGVSATIHRLHTVIVRDREVELTINSFVDADATMVAWQDIYMMPYEDFANSTYPINVFDYLTSTSGPFPGGAVVHDPSELDALKRTMSVRINQLRQATIDNGCDTPAGVMDTNEASRANIQASYTLALAAKMSGEPFSIVWRRLDNTEVTLGADNMIAVARAVFVHVERAMRHSWHLKALVEAATSVEELDALPLVGWRNDYEVPLPETPEPSEGE